MKTIKACICIATVALLPTCLFAHAGMFDRYLEYSVSARAFFYTSLVVQALLSAITFGLLHNTRLLRRFRVLCWRWSKKWFYLLLFICAIPFLTLPLVDMDYVHMWLIAGGSLLIIMITYAVLSFKLIVTKARTPSWRKLYPTLIFTAQQVVTYCVYLLTYNTELMRYFFNYTDDEYQIANYVVYPKLRILDTHIEGCVSLFIILLCWSIFLYLFVFVRNWWHRRKELKTNTITI